MRRFAGLFKIAFSEWNRRDATRMGASLAFYSLLSLAPLLVLIVGICALVFGGDRAEARLLEQFREMVGTEGANTLQTVLKSAKQPATGILANVIGLATLLLGASGVLVELRTALNELWDIRPPASKSGIWGMVRERFLSFGMVLGVGFLLLISLSVSAALSVVGSYFGQLGWAPPTLLEALNFLVSMGVVSAMFASILRFVPDTRLPWRNVLHGAVVTAVLFTVGKTAIGIYLGKAAVGSAYGAAGSLVVLIVWIYYSAQIFYYGAIFTRISVASDASLTGTASYKKG